jgi:hypothetical protein
MKFIKAALATLLYLLLLVSTYYIHIAYLKVDVVFYAALADAVIATGMAALVLYLLGYFRALNGFEKFQLVVIWSMLGYILAITVPTIIDRSLSFYILEKIQQRGGGIKFDAFEQVFTKEYVKEDRLVDVRLTEQQESGTIVIDHGCVMLTEKGKTLAQFSRYFRQHFLPKQRLLMGKYSDDLVDPFRDSAAHLDYLCQ